MLLRRFLVLPTILLAVVSFSSVELKALTLSDLETEARVLLHDSGEVGRQTYPDATLDDYLNEAQRDIVNQTWCLQKSYDISLTSGTTFYALPTDTISVQHVRYKGASNSISVLNQLPLKKLYEDNPNWANTGGAISNYTIDQGTISTQLRMGFYKPPLTSSTGTVTVFYSNQPTDMTSDSDVPFDSYYHLYPYHMAIVYHAVGRIMLREGRTSEAQAYISFYTTSIQTMRENLGRMPDYNPTGHSYSPTMPR